MYVCLYVYVVSMFFWWFFLFWNSCPIGKLNTYSRMIIRMGPCVEKIMGSFVCIQAISFLNKKISFLALIILKVFCLFLLIFCFFFKVKQIVLNLKGPYFFWLSSMAKFFDIICWVWGIWLFGTTLKSSIDKNGWAEKWDFFFDLAIGNMKQHGGKKCNFQASFVEVF